MSKLSFRNLNHEGQDDSGLIAPREVWKSPTPATVIDPWAPKKAVAAPTLEEKQQAALADALNYLRQLEEYEAENLPVVLALRHSISQKDAEAIVIRAEKILADPK